MMAEPRRMKAMVLRQSGRALCHEERDLPSPGPGQVRVRVEACAVCRTDLHVVDGELPDRKLPIVPGHEIVGIVEAAGEGVAGIAPGARVGVAWLEALLGIWMIIAPWLLGFSSLPVVTWNSVIVGIALIVISVDSMRTGLMQSA